MLGVPGLRRDHPDAWALVRPERRPRRRDVEPRCSSRSARSWASPTTSSSGLVDYADAGAFEISAGVDPRRLPAALEAILAELVAASRRARARPTSSTRRRRTCRAASSCGWTRLATSRRGSAARRRSTTASSRSRRRSRRSPRSTPPTHAARRRALPRRGPAAGRRRPGPVRARPRAPPPPAGMTIAEKPVDQDSDERAADLVLARLHLRLGLARPRPRRARDARRDATRSTTRGSATSPRFAGGPATWPAPGRPPRRISRTSRTTRSRSSSRRGRSPISAGRARRGGSPARQSRPARDRSTRCSPGCPRSSVWPVDSGGPIEPAGTLFADLEPPASLGRGGLRRRGPGGAAERRRRRADATPRRSRPDAARASGRPRRGTVAQALPDPAELARPGPRRARGRSAGPGGGRDGPRAPRRPRRSRPPCSSSSPAGRSRSSHSSAAMPNSIVGHGAEAMRDYAAAVAAIGLERRSDDRDEPEPSRCGHRRRGRRRANPDGRRDPAVDDDRQESPPIPRRNS